MTVKRIMRVSSWLHFACTVTLLAVPMIFVTSFFMGEFTAHALVDANPGIRVDASPGGWSVAGYLAIDACLGAMGLYVLWQVRALFGAYSGGALLTAESAARLLRAGTGMLTLAASGILAHGAQSVLLTWGNAPGRRQLSLHLSNGDLGFLLCGGLLLVVGWAMVEAARMAEENRSFI